MKKLYYIKTQNAIIPEQHGFIMDDSTRNLNQIKLFNTEQQAENFLISNRDNMRQGWIHSIHPGYFTEQVSKKSPVQKEEKKDA